MEKTLAEKLQSKFDKDIDNNTEKIKDILEKSVDLIERDFVFHKNVDVKVVCFYTDGLVNTDAVEKVINSLQYKTSQLIADSYVGPSNLDIPKKVIENLLINPSIKTINKVGGAIDAILTGDSIFLIDGSNEVLLLSSRGWDTRAVDEPAAEQVVRGPRDGFTENIRTNTTLVRRRIRDPLLRIDSMVIGSKTKTDINLAYLKGTVKDGLVKEVKSRLSKIKVDSILESGYIEELIEDAPLSPFPTIQSTERPDKVAAAILEGPQ